MKLTSEELKAAHPIGTERHIEILVEIINGMFVAKGYPPLDVDLKDPHNASDFLSGFTQAQQQDKRGGIGQA